MSFKRAHEKMSDICQNLAKGMRKNGFTEQAIESLTNQLEGFAMASQKVIQLHLLCLLMPPPI